MRLKKLILHGFKSFADRTEFRFDNPITGIVGPNGCGKSNVVDGFKWVLGEQSAKSLRGDAMMDVIFNGSAVRKPSGMSEVVLVFDNPKRADGVRTLNLDIDEVQVGRRLFRDGTSEYQINNTAARLKDVRELFLDTGVGVDAYSVIEQGRVAGLLEANPEERRQIFEEAAGISKFKARKKETQRKLEKVDQNLLRVNDIVEEVEKRLRSVKVQAGRARTFKEHSTRLAELRLSHSLQEYHTQTTQFVELEGKRDDAKFRLDDATGDLSKSEAALAEKREQTEVLSGQKQRLEHELVQTEAQIQAARQREQYANEQLQQMAEQLQANAADQTALQTKTTELQASLAAETQRLEQLTQELKNNSAQIDQRQIAFRDGQLQLNQMNQQIEQTKTQILDLMRKIAAANSRLGAVEIERKNIKAQQDRSNSRRSVVAFELEQLQAAADEFRAKLDETLAQIARQQQQFESKRAEADALDKQISQVGEQLGSAKEHRSGLISRQRLLEDLEAKREGISEGVKSVLRDRDTRFPFVHGLVADVLRVDVEHATVIEAALDGRDQLLVSHDSSAVAAAETALDELEGRVSILCTDELPPETDGYDWNQHPYKLRLAIDLVRVEPADMPVARRLLGKTVVVDDLAAARQLRRLGPAGYRYVTMGNQVLEADGTVRAGPLNAAMSLISRRSELESLGMQIAEVDQRISQLSKQLAENNTQARTLEDDIGTLRNAVYQSNTIKVQHTSSLAQNNDRQNILRREQPVIDRELANLSAQLAKLQEEQEKLQQARQGFEAAQAENQKKVDDLTAGQKQAAEDLRVAGEQLNALRVAQGQVQEKQLASQQAVRRQTSSLAELAEQIERLAKSAKAIEARRGDVQHDAQIAAHMQQSLAESLTAIKGRIETVAADLATATAAVTELAQQVEQQRTAREEIEHCLHELELQVNELRVRRETLVQRTSEELQLDLPARYTELNSDGKTYQPEAIDWSAVADEIKTLREKIARLGNVNVDAINEQDELEKRELFLTTQVTDLTTSKQQLEQLINEINVESSTRFEQTFNAVREHFQGIFRKLFGGGKADVYLETELDPPRNAPVEIGPDGQPLPPQKIHVDILDAGIEIIARPPGKQPVGISQLSGGEKTMTCVALLLSIFKSKPSPFCILDEVDAALDEANNQRFNLIVQEFLEQSQFIIITHSKRTMQIADVLYGVTMQEQGVSKRVAVKFDQVAGDGKIAQAAIDAAAQNEPEPSVEVTITTARRNAERPAVEEPETVPV